MYVNTLISKYSNTQSVLNNQPTTLKFNKYLNINNNNNMNMNNMINMINMNNSNIENNNNNMSLK